jgi:hypothetical protein
VCGDDRAIIPHSLIQEEYFDVKGKVAALKLPEWLIQDRGLENYIEDD